MPRAVTLIAVLLLAAVVLVRASRGGGDTPARELRGRVVRITDGDTIRVALAGRVERVRYIGIDTPEEVRPGTPVQCFARRAAAENARLVAGRTVRLVLDAEPRDRFGRLLAYVYRASDGVFVNAALVGGGFARTLTVPPNVRYARRFAALARRARRAGRGLWSAACPST